LFIGGGKGYKHRLANRQHFTAVASNIEGRGLGKRKGNYLILGAAI